MQTFIVVHLVLLILACWCLHWRSVVKKSQQNTQKVTDAYRRGEYEEGLRLAETLKKGRTETAAYCFHSGKLLYELGRLDEAEGTLRAGLARENASRPKALAREALGRVLLELERYEEATESFEACVLDFPQRGAGHRGVAEVWLRQGIQSDDALTRARQAAELDRAASGLKKEIYNFNLGEASAALAWAVAVQSRDGAEVDKLVARAMLLCREESKPLAAQVNYHAGMAYAALGNTSQSAHYFRAAAEVDPSGNFGRRATAARLAEAG
jgi:tetratricopeptide (TPR) repeat protein